MEMLNCGHVPTPTDFTPGYGIMRSTGEKICYTCCAENDKESLRKDPKHYGYMTKDANGQWFYVNWPGSLKFRIAHWEGKHNWRGVTQHYGNFFFEGNWYFVRMVTNGNSECATARKVKKYPFSMRYENYETRFGEVKQLSTAIGE